MICRTSGVSKLAPIDKFKTTVMGAAQIQNLSLRKLVKKLSFMNFAQLWKVIRSYFIAHGFISSDRYYLQRIRDGRDRRDATPIFHDPMAFRACILDMCEPFRRVDFEYVVGIDALGFIIGSAMAMELHKGFIPIRKGGKLPVENIGAVTSGGIELRSTYKEFDVLELQRYAIPRGARVVIADEWVNTGTQMEAAIALVEHAGGLVVGIATLHMDPNDKTAWLRKKYRCHVLCDAQNHIVPVDCRPVDTPKTFRVTQTVDYIFLDRYGLARDRRDADVAAGRGDVMRLAELLNIGAVPDSWAVFKAAKHGHHACLRLLLDCGIRPNAKTAKWPAGNGDMTSLKMLIDAKAPIDEWALWWACNNNHLACFKELVAAKAPLNSVSMRLALQNPEPEYLQWLIHAGYDIQSDIAIMHTVMHRLSAALRTLLACTPPVTVTKQVMRYVVAHDLRDYLELLLQHGAQVDRKIMAAAIQHDHIECLRVLLRDTDLPHHEMSLVISLAVRRNCVPALRILLDHGHIPVPGAFTEAVKHNRVECLRLLLAATRDTMGAVSNHALRLATEPGHEDCFALLRHDWHDFYEAAEPVM